MNNNLQKILEKQPIEALAPCRIDLGGTLDIRTFHLPLRHLRPCTFNIALDMNTRVTLHPYKDDRIRISSRGFQDAEFQADEVPFDHPMGLMFAIASYFRANGVHIKIDSSSPPRSALGGSSAAAVALVAAFSSALQNQKNTQLSKSNIAILAHAIEESVAGVPCGFQDQLAAVYGGINAWYWPCHITEPPFRREPVILEQEQKAFRKHFIVAYCGIPHVSADINGLWVKQFLAGKYRQEWGEIILCTKNFIDSLGEHNYKGASEFMQRETSIRMEMTPDVLDDMGKKLADAATRNQCGARFTGAGGGGCIWALGDQDDIEQLGSIWQEILKEREDACLLDTKINSTGLIVNR
jgi:D-glycero-alpha-D-manno-heptose-7-phosphate kinase